MKFKYLTIKMIIASTLFGFSYYLQCFASNSFHVKSGDNALQNEVLVEINKYRKQQGLPHLIMNEHMVIEAKKHSMDMARHSIPFGHSYFHSRINTLHSLIKNAGASAENVAYNYKDAHDVVKNWLRSPGHKRNIDGHYNLTGVGIARDTKGKIYYTQIFLNTEKNHTHRKKPLISRFRSY